MGVLNNRNQAYKRDKASKAQTSNSKIESPNKTAQAPKSLNKKGVAQPVKKNPAARRAAGDPGPDSKSANATPNSKKRPSDSSASDSDKQLKKPRSDSITCATKINNTNTSLKATDADSPTTPAVARKPTGMFIERTGSNAIPDPTFSGGLPVKPAPPSPVKSPMPEKAHDMLGGRTVPIVEAKVIPETISASDDINVEKVFAQFYQVKLTESNAPFVKQILVLNKLNMALNKQVSGLYKDINQKNRLLEEKTAVVAERDAALADKDQLLADKDRKIEDMDRQIARYINDLGDSKTLIQSYNNVNNNKGQRERELERVKEGLKSRVMELEMDLETLGSKMGKGDHQDREEDGSGGYGRDEMEVQDE